MSQSTSLSEHKKTVMICDDEQDLLQLFGLALGLKYNAILTSTGKDCIDKFIEEKKWGHKVHLILLDYRLGDMLGDLVARKIKAYNGTKIILISAFDLDRELVEELKENKYIVKYIAKPIRVADLMGLVADTLVGHSDYMSQQQLLLRQDLTISQILRTHGKQFMQVTKRYSDGRNGRCAFGVIMSYYGWNGKDDSNASSKLLGARVALRQAGIDKNLLIELNDSGFSFDEIANYFDRANELTNLK